MAAGADGLICGSLAGAIPWCDPTTECSPGLDNETHSAGVRAGLVACRHRGIAALDARPRGLSRKTLR
jgi:hypothetical protein